MANKAKIITVAGKGGVGKTSICASIVRLLVEKYPDNAAARRENLFLASR